MPEINLYKTNKSNYEDPTFEAIGNRTNYTQLRNPSVRTPEMDDIYEEYERSLLDEGSGYAMRKNYIQAELNMMLDKYDEENVMDNLAKHSLARTISEGTGLSEGAVYGNIEQYVRNLTGVDIKKDDGFKGWLSQMSDTWSGYSDQLDMADSEFKALFFDEDSYSYKKYIEMADASAQKASGKQRDFSKRTWVGNYLVENAQFLAQQWDQAKYELGGRALGAVLGGAFLGMSGAKAGAKVVGTTTGLVGRAFNSWKMFKLEAGSFAREMRQMVDSDGNALSQDIIRETALGYATASSIVEQFDLVEMGIEKLARKALGDTKVNNVIMTIMSSIGRAVLESNEEGIQQALQTLALESAKEYSNELGLTNFELEADKFGKALKDGWKEFYSTLGPMGLTSLMGIGFTYTNVRSEDIMKSADKYFTKNHGGEYVNLKSLDTGNIQINEALEAEKAKDLKPITVIREKIMGKNRYKVASEEDAKLAEQLRLSGEVGAKAYIFDSETAKIGNDVQAYSANSSIVESGINTIGVKDGIIYFDNASDLESGANILQKTKLNVSKKDDVYNVYGVINNKAYKYTLKVATDADKNTVSNVNFSLYSKIKDKYSELGDDVVYMGAEVMSLYPEINGRSAEELLDEGLILLQYADKDAVAKYKEAHRAEVEAEAKRLGLTFDKAQINGWLDTNTKDGKSLYTINLSNTADVRTIAHEVGHTIRAFSSTEQLSGFVGLEGFTGEAGAMWQSDIKEENGKYRLGSNVYDTYGEAYSKVVGNEEKFVDMLLQYVQNGECPNQKVQSVFDKILEFLGNIREKLADRISPEAKQALDKLFTTKSGKASGFTGTAFEITDSEYDNIKSELQKNPKNWDGENWLAPNGEISNLTEKQYLQTRSPQFIAWFGDWINDPTNSSKVLDENGEPLVVYHGTVTGGFDTFNSENGVFFTDDYVLASEYAGNDSGFATSFIEKSDFEDFSDGSEPNLEVVYPCFIKLENPKMIEADGASYDNIEGNSTREIFNNLEPESDGAIIYNVADFASEEELGNVYIVRGSNQIKSATDNNGDFSTSKDSILFSIEEINNKIQNLSEKYSSCIEDKERWKGESVSEFYRSNQQIVLEFIRECPKISIDGLKMVGGIEKSEDMPFLKEIYTAQLFRQFASNDIVMLPRFVTRLFKRVFGVSLNNGSTGEAVYLIDDTGKLIDFKLINKNSFVNEVDKAIKVSDAVFTVIKDNMNGNKLLEKVNKLVDLTNKTVFSYSLGSDVLYLVNKKGAETDTLKFTLARKNEFAGEGLITYSVTHPNSEYITLLKNVNENEMFSFSKYQDISESSLFQITSKEEDKAYFKAIQNNDLDRAFELVKAKAEKNGYKTDYEYRGYHTAPNRNGLTESERRKIVKEGSDVVSVSINDIAEGYSPVPEIMFAQWERDGWHWKSARKFNSIIKMIRSTADSEGKTSPVDVTVYRAIPKRIKETGLRNGDWVALTQDYAQEHADAHNEPYKVISQTVSSSDLFWDGNDINEFGYDDGKNYAYQDTKNNVKSFDVITYDENGNIIPLSKRFNKYISSPLFEITSKEDYFANDNVKNEIEYAVRAGAYIRPEYVEAYRGEKWADDYLEMQQLQAEKPELFAEAERYNTYDDWHDTIVANMDFFDSITPEQEAQYRKIYESAHSGIATPEIKDAIFISGHTTTDEQMLDLAKNLSKYKDAQWISSEKKRNHGRYGITAKWGTFKGVSTKVKRLYSATSGNTPSIEQIAEARALVQANPRVYRKAYETAQLGIARANAVHDNFGNINAIRQALNDINTAYDIENMDERIEADLNEIEMKKDAPIIKQDVTQPIIITEDKPQPEVASLTENKAPKIDGYTFVDITEKYNLERKDITDKYKSKIQQAVDAGEYIDSRYIRVYENEDWARNELDVRKYLMETPEVKDSILDNISKKPKYDFDTWLSEQGLSDADADTKDFYFEVFNRVTMLSPEQADKAFATEWTGSREKLIELGKALSNFSRTSKNYETRFGGIRGVNLNAIMLDNNSTEAEITRAREIIQKNPRPYRLSYQEAYNDYSNSSYGKKETRDRDIIGLNAKLDTIFERIDDNEDDAIVQQERNAYASSIQDIDTEIQQSNEVLKALGLDGASEKEINDKLAEIIANADERNITEKIKYQTALEELRNKIRLEAEKKKRINTMEAIKKESTFSETSTDVSFVPLFNWIQSIFAVDGNRKEMRAKVNSINRQLQTTTDKNTIASLQAEKRTLLNQINESSALVVPPEARVFFDDATLQKMDNRQSKWTQEELDELYSKVAVVRQVAMQKYSNKKQVETNRRMNFISGIVQDATGVDLQEGLDVPVSARDVKDFANTIDKSEVPFEFNTANLLFIKNGRLARAIAGGKEGSYYQISQREAFQHQTEQKKQELRREKALTNKMDLLGIDVSELYKKSMEYTKQFSGEVKQLTKSEMIGVYVYSQSNLGIDKLTDKSGNQITKETLSNIIDSLTPEEKAFGDYLIYDMSSRYPTMKSVYEGLYNRPLGWRVNYFPFVALCNDVADTDGYDFLCDVSIDNLAKYVDKSQTKPVNPYARYELNLDVFSSWKTQMLKQEHFIAYAEWSRDMDYIMHKGGAGDVIANKFGTDTKNTIQSYIDSLSSSTGRVDFIDKKMLRFIRRTASAKIIGNPSSALKQVGAIGGAFNTGASLSEIIKALSVNDSEVLNFIRANDLLVGTDIETGSWLGFMYSLAPELESRGIDMDINQAFDSLSNNAVGRAVRKIGEITSKPMEWADNYVVHVVWTASFLHEFNSLKNTMDIESAVREAGFRASQAVSETQNTTEVMDMSEAQRKAQSNWGWNLVTAFQSQAINIYNEFWIDMPQAFKNKEGKKAMRIIGGLLFNAIAMMTIAGSFWKRDDEDEEEKKKRTVKDAIQEVVVNLVPILGNAWWNNWEGYDSNLITSTLSTLNMVPKSLEKAIGGRESGWKFAEDVLKFAGDITGFGSVPFTRIIRMIEEDWNAGYLINSSWGHIVENNR